MAMMDVRAFPKHRAKKGDKRGFMSWKTPNAKKYLLGCCDCGLVHEMQFRVHKGDIQYRCRRANGYTRAMRKAFKHEKR